MLKTITRMTCIALTLWGLSCFAATYDAPQSPLNPAATPARKYPKIVLYSVSWCPHCKEAKEYFTTNNIPFINKDVELDARAMEELTGKYRSQGVPVIVIGDDTVILKGFSQEKFRKALQEAEGKK